MFKKFSARPGRGQSIAISSLSESKPELGDSENDDEDKDGGDEEGDEEGPSPTLSSPVGQVEYRSKKRRFLQRRASERGEEVGDGDGGEDGTKDKLENQTTDQALVRSSTPEAGERVLVYLEGNGGSESDDASEGATDSKTAGEDEKEQAESGGQSEPS